MAYTPAANSSGPMHAIEHFVEVCVKEIRHMDRIEHDPEAQRIKKLVFDACKQSFLLAFPDETVTTHVTLAPTDAVSMSESATPSVTISADQPLTGKCELCKSLHDPRKTYDHAPVLAIR